MGLLPQRDGTGDQGAERPLLTKLLLLPVTGLPGGGGRLPWAPEGSCRWRRGSAERPLHPGRLTAQGGVRVGSVGDPEGAWGVWGDPGGHVVVSVG